MNVDVNKIIEEARIKRDKGICPACSKKIDPEREFKDDLSRKEFGLSGLCQKCQDEFFGEPEQLDYDKAQEIVEEMTPSRVQVALDKIMDIIHWDVYFMHDEIIDDGDDYGPNFSVSRKKIKDVLERLERGS